MLISGIDCTDLGVPRLGFKINDKVTAFGKQGKVSSIDPSSGFVTVDFGGARTFTFTKLGLVAEWHEAPALKLVSRVVSASIVRYVNLYPEGRVGKRNFATREEARQRADENLVEVIELRGQA